MLLARLQAVPPWMAVPAIALIAAGAAFKVLLYNDRPLPKAHRLPKNHFAARRRFLCTGAASGLGKALVTSLLMDGHVVMACDINDAELHRLARTDWLPFASQLLTRRLDVSSGSDWTAALSEVERTMGGLDVCLNVAGFLRPGYTQDCSDKDIAMHVDVNCKGVMLGTAHASRLMLTKKSDHGAHIINVASLGAIAPMSGYSLYIGTKYACRGFSLCAAKDLFPHGVYVTVVMPDAIATPMLDLQAHHKESAMGYSGDALSVDDVVREIKRAMITRPRELKLATTFIRGFGARVADIFSGAVLIGWSEDTMRKKGEAAQAKVLQQSKR